MLIASAVLPFVSIVFSLGYCYFWKSIFLHHVVGSNLTEYVKLWNFANEGGGLIPKFTRLSVMIASLIQY